MSTWGDDAGTGNCFTTCEDGSPEGAGKATATLAETIGTGAQLAERADEKRSAIAKDREEEERTAGTTERTLDGPTIWADCSGRGRDHEPRNRIWCYGVALAILRPYFMGPYYSATSFQCQTKWGVKLPCTNDRSQK